MMKNQETKKLVKYYGGAGAIRQRPPAERAVIGAHIAKLGEKSEAYEKLLSIADQYDTGNGMTECAPVVEYKRNLQMASFTPIAEYIIETLPTNDITSLGLKSDNPRLMSGLSKRLIEKADRYAPEMRSEELAEAIVLLVAAKDKRRGLRHDKYAWEMRRALRHTWAAQDEKVDKAIYRIIAKLGEYPQEAVHYLGLKKLDELKEIVSPKQRESIARIAMVGALRLAARPEGDWMRDQLVESMGDSWNGWPGTMQSIIQKYLDAVE